MPTLEWIGKNKVVNHHQEVPFRVLERHYTNREIAESLGLTNEVVRMRLFRGRKLLWKELNSRE